MASLDGGIPYGGPEVMSRRSDNSSSEDDTPSSRRGGVRSKAGAKTTAQRVNSGKFAGLGQTTLGFGREKNNLLKAAKNNAAKTAVATSGGLGGHGAAAKASAAKTMTATGQGIGAAAKASAASAASAASTMAPTNEGSGGASLSSSNKGELDLDALLDLLGPYTLASPRASGREKWEPASRPASDYHTFAEASDDGATTFAYGPTGVGKTHTMMGSSENAGGSGIGDGPCSPGSNTVDLAAL